MSLQKIIIENIKIHSNHGCMKEEEKIGSEYRVDIEIIADLFKSAITDDLKDTVDYVTLNKIIHEIMYKRAKLLETVAYKILEKIGEKLPMVQFAEVSISKINPPMGGNVESVKVVFNKNYYK